MAQSPQLKRKLIKEPVSLYEKQIEYGNKSNFSELVRVMSKDAGCHGLAAAKSCLAVGPGNGQCEVEFIKHLMPQLQTLTAVEPNNNYIVQLKANLHHHLRQVESIVHEKTIQEFIAEIGDKPQPFDVILIFIVVHLVDAEDRPVLLRYLFTDLISPGGHLIASHPHKVPNGLFAVLEKLNPNHPVPPYVDLKAEILKAGLQLEREFQWQFDWDTEKCDEESAVYLSEIVDKNVTVDEFNGAVSSVLQDSKTLNIISCLGVFNTASDSQ